MISQKVTLINQTLLECLDKNDELEIVKTFTDLAVKILDASFGFVWLNSSQDGAFKLVYRSPKLPYEPKQPTKHGRNYKAITYLTPDYVTDVSEHDDTQYIKNYMKSFVILPIAYKDKVYGNAVICFKQPESFPEEKKVLCAIIGSSIAQVITIHRLILSEQKARVAAERAELQLFKTLTDFREAETRLRKLAENINDVLWVSSDDRKKTLYMSPKYESIFGESVKEIYKDSFSFMKHIHPDDLALVKESQKDFSSGSYNVTCRVIRPTDGQIRWINNRAYPVYDEKGNVTNVVGIASDITESKQREEEKNNFIAMISHELRNPLTPIMIGMNMLRLKLDKIPLSGDSADIKNYLNIIDRQTKNISRLLDDLLDISRISRGKINLKMEKIPLNDCLENAIIAVQPLIEKQNHHLILSLPGEAVYLKADPVRLEQIIINLLNNAAKYTRSGGQIWLTAKKEDGRIFISVRDNGIGIKPEMIDSIFNRPDHLSRPFVTSQGELGIGLKLTKELVRLQDGKISVKSEGEGKGCEFIVVLPLISPEINNSPVAKTNENNSALDNLNLHAAKDQAIKKRILVVEDDGYVAQLLTEALNFFGYYAKSCGNANSAYRLIENYRPQIIFIDIGLPDASGYEVAEKIREKERGSKNETSLKLVALTGYGQEEDKVRSLNAGFNLHLVKPVGLTALQKALDDLNI